MWSAGAMADLRSSAPARVRAAVVAAAALALVGTGCADGDGASTTTAAPATTADPTPAAADVGGADWPVYGHDAANSRTNLAEEALDAGTVGDLALDWSRDSLVGVTGTPSVVDGVGYVGDWTGAVRAFHVATGEDRWTYQLGGSIVGSPAVVDDAVYASAGRTLVRIDRATGGEVWRVDVHDHPQAQISASPIVVDGLVVQGVASFENILVKDDYTFRGSIGAYDAGTGAEVWRLLTTQDDDEGGMPAVSVEVVVDESS